MNDLSSSSKSKVTAPVAIGELNDSSTRTTARANILFPLREWWNKAPMQTRIASFTLGFGIIALALPTMLFVARETWSTEQGAHGPIVLFTGLWLIARTWKTALPMVPPPAWRPLLLVPFMLALFTVARISQIIEVEGFLMYGALLACIYGLTGGKFLWKLIFPLAYLAFVFPPPETLIYAITLPMKIIITEGAVSLLAMFGYPIGHTGVWIQVGQYQLLMAAACSGLNSIVSLSVLGTFYIYVRYAAKGMRSLLLMLLIIPVAILANFVRVLILILLTYHAGEAAAQGFLHNFAGLTMFAVALLIIFGFDNLIGKFLPSSKASSNPWGPESFSK
jgi:exosortase